MKEQHNDSNADGTAYYDWIAMDAWFGMRDLAWDLVCANRGETGKDLEDKIRGGTLKQVMDRFIEHGSAPEGMTVRDLGRAALRLLRLPETNIRTLSSEEGPCGPGVVVRLENAEWFLMDTRTSCPPHSLDGHWWKYTVRAGAKGEQMDLNALPTPVDLAILDRLYPTLGLWAARRMKEAAGRYRDLP